MSEINRFEVIDHRRCVWCHGTKVSEKALSDGTIVSTICEKCDGSGIRGGRILTARAKVKVSYQDDGKTLKVFLDDLN